MVGKSRLARVYDEGRESEKETNPAVYPEMRTARLSGYPALAGGMGCDGEPVEFRWRVEMSTLSWPFYQEVSRMEKGLIGGRPRGNETVKKERRGRET